LKFKLLLISIFFFVSLLGQHTFTNVATQMGFTGFSGLGHAVGWCDIDNDGDLDLACSNQNNNGFWLFRNDSTIFTDITISAGLSTLTAYRFIWAEVTGDIYTDLIIDTWNSGQKLYQNNGNGTFTDITSGSGISTSVCAAADFDNDGDVDLVAIGSSTCNLLLNSGNAVFTSVSVGACNSVWSGVCLDYDIDGYIDIYLGTYGDYANKLYKNNGNNTFTDVTTSAGVEYTGTTSGITTGDYNNDGYEDLYLANYSSSLCKLFENQGNGTFSDVTAVAGVAGYSDTRTAAFGDYNNDGFLDIFVSHHNFYSYSNVLWKNNGNGTFTNTSVAMNISGEWIGDYFGVAWGDFNKDGALDLFAVGHIDKYNLFRNDNCPGNYLTITLIGDNSNYNAIGAKVQVWYGTKGLTRFVTAGEGAKDFHSYPLEFGLDTYSNIDSMEITWPSGLIQDFGFISGNQFITITEGISSVNEENNIIVNNDYEIFNSPNPFRESTVINFSIPVDQYVTLDIYNKSGQKVNTLINQSLNAGAHQIVFNRSEYNELAAGIYFYYLKTSDFSQMKKMLLIE